MDAITSPWMLSDIGSTRRHSWPGSPGLARSSPEDQAEMARRNLKSILHLDSPLSSIKNWSSPSRVVKSAGKAVPLMKLGTKELDVLIIDAVPIQFSRGMEEQRGSGCIKPYKSEEERSAQKEESIPAPEEFIWSPSQEEEVIITEVEMANWYLRFSSAKQFQTVGSAGQIQSVSGEENVVHAPNVGAGGANLAQGGGANAFLCYACPRQPSFINLKGLNEHTNKVHRHNKFMCRVCKCKFKSAVQLSAHQEEYN